MTCPRVKYSQRPDATPESELNALAAAYRFILDRHERKKAAPASRPEDAERRSSEIGAAEKYTG